GLRPGFEPVQPDLLARVDAIAVIALVDATDDALDLVDQLAVAVAGAQFQRVLGFAAGTLGLVADVANFVLEVLDGLARLVDQFLAAREQLLPEVLQLQRVHVFLVRTGLVACGQDRTAGLGVGLVGDDLELRLHRGRRGLGGHRNGDLALHARGRRPGRGRRRRRRPGGGGTLGLPGGRRRGYRLHRRRGFLRRGPGGRRASLLGDR